MTPVRSTWRLAQWIERRPPEADGLSAVLALRGPDGNRLGFMLYGSRPTPVTPAILCRVIKGISTCAARGPPLMQRSVSRWVSTWTGSWQR
jgi:hypothetical protein